MKNELTINGSSRTVKMAMTVRHIASKILHIMENHIGSGNFITRRALFFKVFRKKETDSLEDYLRWDFVKKAMSLCRKQTKCFITSMRTGADFVYFVINSEVDAQYYIDNLESNIKKMRYMQRRAKKAGIECWGNLDWGEIKQIGMKDGKQKTNRSN